MARLRFTSLVTTKSDPARWWPRVAILGVGLVVAVMVVLSIGPSRGTTLGFFVLSGLALVVHRFRVGLGLVHEPLRHPHGEATYEHEGRAATFTGADGVAVHVDGSDLRSVELDASDALVLERRDRTTLRLMASRRAVLARVAADLGHAQALVRRVEGGSAVSRLEKTAAGAAMFGAVVVALVTLSTWLVALGDADHGRYDAGPIAAALVSLALSVSAALAFVPSHIRVGADGVSYRFLMRPRFVRFARIDRVQQGDRGVWLTLVDGRELLLPTTGIARARLAEYIEDGREAARASAGVGALGALLDRGARSIDEWKRAVEGLATNTGGYRAQIATPDQLRQIVEDGGAPPGRRVAAAIALRRATGKQKRIRFAAQASADEALRVALEAAADGEIAEEALERATAHHLHEDGS